MQTRELKFIINSNNPREKAILLSCEKSRLNNAKGKRTRANGESVYKYCFPFRTKTELLLILREVGGRIGDSYISLDDLFAVVAWQDAENFIGKD